MKNFKIHNNLTNSNKLCKFNKEIREELDKFPSVITIPVLWGNIDSFNHMNNMWYLSFVQEGRVDHNLMLSLYLDSQKFKNFIGGKGKSLIVKQVLMKYIASVTFPDSLTVATKVKNITQNTLVYHSKVYSSAQDKLVGESEVLMCGFDYKKGKKSDIDASYIEALKKLENDPKNAQELAINMPHRIKSNL